MMTSTKISTGLYADASIHDEAEMLDIALDMLRELDSEAADRYTADNADYFGTVDDDDDDAEPYEWIGEMIDEVSELISGYLPDYQYAGYSGVGDGWGIWINLYAAQEDARYGEIATLDDDGILRVKGVEIPTLAIHVNDHGNTTLYRLRVETEEVWSVV